MRNNTKKKKSKLIWYLFLTPTIFGVVVFMLYPVVESFRLSFFKSNGTIEQWVGLGNYEFILSLDVFGKAIYNTFYLSFFQLLICIPLGFIIASIINELRFGQNLFKVLFYIPNITSAVAAAIVFQFILHPDGGLLNHFLSMVGLPTSVWLAEPTSARWGAIILSSWRFIGFTIIIYLANMQAIPLGLYEAASIDGANKLKAWRYITIPNMWPTFSFLVVMGWIGGLQRFADVYILGGLQGSPARSLHTLVGFIFERGFGGYEFGVAAAASYVLFILIFLVTFINTKITKMKV